MLPAIFANHHQLACIQQQQQQDRWRRRRLKQRRHYYQNHQDFYRQAAREEQDKTIGRLISQLPKRMLLFLLFRLLLNARMVRAPRLFGVVLVLAALSVALPVPVIVCIGESEIVGGASASSQQAGSVGGPVVAASSYPIENLCEPAASEHGELQQPVAALMLAPETNHSEALNSRASGNDQAPATSRPSTTGGQQRRTAITSTRRRRGRHGEENDDDDGRQINAGPKPDGKAQPLLRNARFSRSRRKSPQLLIGSRATTTNTLIVGTDNNRSVGETDSGSVGGRRRKQQLASLAPIGAAPISEVEVAQVRGYQKNGPAVSSYSYSSSSSAAGLHATTTTTTRPEHKRVAISSARTSIWAGGSGRSSNNEKEEEERVLVESESEDEKEEVEDVATLGEWPAIKRQENEPSRPTTSSTTTTSMAKRAKKRKNEPDKDQVIDEIQTNVAASATSSSSPTTAADETKKYDDKRLTVAAVTTSTMAKTPVKGYLADTLAPSSGAREEHQWDFSATGSRQGAPRGARLRRYQPDQSAARLLQPEAAQTLAIADEETATSADAQEQEQEQEPVKEERRLSNDQPSHGNSLAKMKLFAKTEPSMINFALINGKANLACDIRAPSSDDSVALVLWYKDDSLAPIYTIDARKVNSLDRAKISVDDQYSSRLSFNAKAKPAQLELEQLRQDDEGDYRCRVDFKRGRTVNTIISLRIIIPPRELSIFMVTKPDADGLNHQEQQQQQDDGQGLAALASTALRLFSGTNNSNNNRSMSLVKLPTNGGLIGPFNEDSELELVCVAYGGKPRPELSWKRDFSVLNSTTQLAGLDKDGTSVGLKIEALQRQHLLSIFTCQASNNNLTSPLQSSLTLDLNLKPKEVMIRQVGGSHDGPLQVGQTATFECVTTGSRPQATIHWIFQGQRHDSPMNVDQQQTSSRLSLVLQRSFNQQPLVCVAENPRISSSSSISGGSGRSSASGTSAGGGGSASKRATIKLDVHYPPQLSVRLDKQNDKRQQTTSDQAGGAGSTTATQQQQQQASDPNVNGDELVSSSASVLKNLQEGNDIYLTCQMDANPRPLKQIVWRFNGRQLVSSGLSGASSASTASNQPNQQQQQGTIVINNNSLVLRKVSRHQSGAYTCEASNQLGTNTSRPFELVIKHAPVCKTDDILVYEAAIGQVVNIDCQVIANPARSVHFSWFVSYGSSNNKSDDLTDWLDRDTSLDEQLDDSSSQLKFRIKDEDSFAHIKCKAKNEIGLQQRVCLFQIVPAREPELQHSCSLASSSVQGLGLQCQLNEHLKTNQIQQLSTSSESSSSSSSGSSSVNADATARSSSSTLSTTGQSKQQDPLTWMRNYNAMKQSLASSSGGGSSSSELLTMSVRRLQQQQQRPRLRQIYPPDWLLVELYRALPSVTYSTNTLAQLTNSTTKLDEPPGSGYQSSVDYELQSYIIVAPSASQLARVKSIVEENKLFQALPRDIYYVTTKTDPKQRQAGIDTNGGQQYRQSAEKQGGTGEEAPLGEEAHASQLDRSAEASPPPLGEHFELDQPEPLAIGPNDEQAPIVVKDPSLKLPNAFNFSVPNLEPATKYKLLIFGQNLANKTRDWLVVRGETAPGQMHQAPAAAQKSVKNLVLDQDQADQANSAANYSTQPSQSGLGTMGQSKSIVMRSDQTLDKSEANEHQQADSAGGTGTGQPDMRGGPTGHLLTPSESVGGGPGGSSGLPSAILADGGHKFLLKFHHYKDQALAYVKERPLMTIPAMLASLLLIVILVVYLSGLFVGLMRRRQTRPLIVNGCDQSNDSSNLSSADSTTSRASSSNHQLSQTAAVGQKHRNGSLVKSSSTLNDHDDRDDERPHSCDKKQQQQQQLDSLMPQLGLIGESHSFGPSIGSFNSVATSNNTITNQQTSTSTHNNSASVSLHPQTHHHHHPSWDCLDALALDQQQQHHQMLARPSWQETQLRVACSSAATDYHSGQQMLGSLDRRGHFHPAATIYLAPNGAPSSTTSDHHQEAHIPLVNGSIFQEASASWSDQHKRIGAPGGGSIDRRSFTSANGRNGFILQQQHQYQPLFIADHHQHHEQLQLQQWRPTPKGRTRLRSNKSSVQSQHRVAFDLSNQELGQQQQQQLHNQENEYASGGLLQLTRGPDSSSGGSNNSTAANTADSGHESPATTGGETNSCQSGRQRSQQQRAAANQTIQIIEGTNGMGLTRPGPCQKHPQYQLPTGGRNITPIEGQSLTSDASACNCPHKQLSQLQQQQQTNQMHPLMLMEFASPSSQESSTFLPSVDSSFDANQPNNNNSNGNGNNMTFEQQHDPNGRSTASYLLQQNYQMATSFASNQNANGQPIIMGLPLDEANARDADNWL